MAMTRVGKRVGFLLACHFLTLSKEIFRIIQEIRSLSFLLSYLALVLTVWREITFLVASVFILYKQASMCQA